MRRTLLVLSLLLSLVLSLSFATVANAQRLPSYDDSNAMHVLAAVVGPLGLLIATGPAWASPCPPPTGWGPRICESSIAMSIVGLGLEALSIALSIAATVMHFEVRAQREAHQRGRGTWGLAPWVGADGAGLAVAAWW